MPWSTPSAWSSCCGCSASSTSCGGGYWQDPWNRLDALLVGLAILDLWILTDLQSDTVMQQFSVLRILRVARLARMIRFLRA